MCGRGKGKGPGYYSKNQDPVSEPDSEDEFESVQQGKRKLELAEQEYEDQRMELDKIAAKIARTEKSEKKRHEKFEKEYANRMDMPASEDKAWWGSSREEMEAKLEEAWGKYRYKEGSKYCRLCFGYGCTNVHGEACEHCVCSCQASRTYLGHDHFAHCCD